MIFQAQSRSDATLTSHRRGDIPGISDLKFQISDDRRVSDYFWAKVSMR